MKKPLVLLAAALLWLLLPVAVAAWCEYSKHNHPGYVVACGVQGVDGNMIVLFTQETRQVEISGGHVKTDSLIYAIHPGHFCAYKVKEAKS